MLYASQWTNGLGVGASGSSTIKANDRHPAGEFHQESGGDMSDPSAVKRVGIISPEPNASDIIPSVCSASNIRPASRSSPARHMGCPPNMIVGIPIVQHLTMCRTSMAMPPEEGKEAAIAVLN